MVPVPAPTGVPIPVPSQVPTRAPSPAPTPPYVPQATTSVSWSTTLGIAGISAADITADDEAAIIDSVAGGSDDVTADDITITSITDSDVRRTRSLLATGVDVVYDTTVVLEETSFTDPSALFSAITTDTASFITSGAFETALQAAGSATLAAADVSEDTFTAPTAFTSADLSPTLPPTCVWPCGMDGTPAPSPAQTQDAVCVACCAAGVAGMETEGQRRRRLRGRTLLFGAFNGDGVIDACATCDCR